ncbi:MAG: cysteine--tRNA ligase [Bacteroidales bacterium]|nr:cysteine--tRNA ligase [Bacteroidales bacterium]MDY0286557.1 cysteine--tRNA ligase [Bacteroidales bacterium]HPE87805.1 cysteine--tRNA ligase [Bacteroidales bacterium]
MMRTLYLYNTLTRKKEPFEPLHPPTVGMYVCGPTVYGEGHLGHARPAITFDLVFRYLRHLGYKVRYVRNITDVGHLENDADTGEDKIAKKARLEQLEPMEVAQNYINSYHHTMHQLNVCDPSIEPLASGHIIEQIEMVEKIIKNGYAYLSQGSVYFDVEKYNSLHHYGILSGRKLEDLVANTRTLEGQQEKHNPADFALWKKANPEHIMRWKSPWSEGFPGWHMECSAMGAKYLGLPFDIHGGGMDLKFPHHESEIAQAVAAENTQPVKYWMHNNMVTINGQKMGKSLGNFITLNEFFTGKHPALEMAYAPMTIRFFILQAHYRSELDFSNEALQASEKGMKRLITALETLKNLSPSETNQVDVSSIKNRFYEAINDDFNTPVLLAHMYDGVRIINSIRDGKTTIDAENLGFLQSLYDTFVTEILGLHIESIGSSGDEKMLDKLMQMVIELRKEAREKKDWNTSDKIRDDLKKAGIQIKDTRDGAEWSRL